MEPIGPTIRRLLKKIASRREAQERPVCRACGTIMVQATPAIYVCPKCAEAKREAAATEGAKPKGKGKGKENA